MIRGIIKALFVGWVTKKLSQRGARRAATTDRFGNTYPDRRAS